MIKRVLLFLGVLLGAPALAAPPLLDVPVRCTLGKDCFIQNYVDRDPGPDFKDYRCGSLGYDGHAGTDFRVATLADMRAGVPVLAAAPGVVVGVRDGEADVSLRERKDVLRPDRKAGNGVRLDHGDGWATQYSHLQQGSVRVRQGQRVAVGEMLGLIGLSGNTEFPHVHFSISHQGKTIDPFTANAAESPANCGNPNESLWSPAARTKLNYQATGVLGAGISDSAPSQDLFEAGGMDKGSSTISPSAPALYLWLELFGFRRDDKLTLELRAPNGELMARNETLAEKNRAIWFAFIGKKRGAVSWPAGRYLGKIQLQRDGEIVLSEERPIAIN